MDVAPPLGQGIKARENIRPLKILRTIKEKFEKVLDTLGRAIDNPLNLKRVMIGSAIFLTISFAGAFAIDHFSDKEAFRLKVDLAIEHATSTDAYGRHVAEFR